MGSAFDTLFSDLCCFLHRGFIALENKTFIIEPMSSNDNDTHFIYRVEKLKLSPGDCGHGFNMSSVAAENHIKNPFQSFHARVRLVLLLLNQPAGILNLWMLHLGAFVYFHSFVLDLIEKCKMTKYQQIGKLTRLDKLPEDVTLVLTHLICTLSPNLRAHAGLANGLYRAGAPSICRHSQTLKSLFESGSKIYQHTVLNDAWVMFRLRAFQKGIGST